MSIPPALEKAIAATARAENAFDRRPVSHDNLRAGIGEHLPSGGMP
jgi:hypothetical protein